MKSIQIGSVENRYTYSSEAIKPSYKHYDGVWEMQNRIAK